MDWLTKKEIADRAKISDSEALEVSILHWKQLYQATAKELKAACKQKRVTIGVSYCGLCQRFAGCNNCLLNCGKWWNPTANALASWQYGNGTHKAFKQAAKELHDKLVSLRKKVKR